MGGQPVSDLPSTRPVPPILDNVDGLEALQNMTDSAWHPSGPLRAELRAGDLLYIPPGWFHGIRTWKPEGDETPGLPFALSVNFWYNCCEEFMEKNFRRADGADLFEADGTNNTSAPPA